jgi:UDP-GlcNAc:undecaprenyl-phosphate GlcNAc-1-phosphate transferase
VIAAVPVGVVVLVAAMNSFNFLDNMDGLAAGTAAIASGTLALTATIGGDPVLGLAACAVAGTAVGFLPLNYRQGRPAALFMGDSGSHLLGLLVPIVAVALGGSGMYFVLHASFDWLFRIPVIAILGFLVLAPRAPQPALVSR